MGVKTSAKDKENFVGPGSYEIRSDFDKITMQNRSKSARGFGGAQRSSMANTKGGAPGPG